MNVYKNPTPTKKFTPVKKNVDTNQNVTPNSNPTNVAFGIARGKCNQDKCECDQYYCMEGVGGPCLQCSHFPTVHQKVDTVISGNNDNSNNNVDKVKVNPVPNTNPTPNNSLPRESKQSPPPPPPPMKKETINKIINKNTPNVNNTTNNSLTSNKFAIKNKSMGNLSTIIPIKQTNNQTEKINNSPPIIINQPTPPLNIPPPPPIKKNISKGNSVCCYDFDAESDNELTMKVGHDITVSDQSDNVWWYGTNHTTGKEGYFPADGYVEFNDTKKSNTTSNTNNNYNNNNSGVMQRDSSNTSLSNNITNNNNKFSVSSPLYTTTVSNSPPPIPPQNNKISSNNTSSTSNNSSSNNSNLTRESSSPKVSSNNNTSSSSSNNSVLTRESSSPKIDKSSKSSKSFSVDVNEEHILSESCKFNLEHLNEKNVLEKIRGIKVYFMGDEECGKTKLINALMKKDFDPSYTPTVFDTHKTDIQLGYGKKFPIEYWDNSGSKKFDAKRLVIFPNVNCYVVCFDLTNVESWNSVMKRHVPFISEEINNPVIIVGTKIDKMKENPSGCVSLSKVREYVTMNLGNYKVAKFLGVSAKKAPSVDILRDMIIYSVLYNPAYKMTRSPSQILSNPVPTAERIYNRYKL